MSVANIENILSRATQDLRELLEEAFEAGRADMKRELATFLSGGDTARMTETVAPPDTEGRAPSGTVKPGIKTLIENASNGVTASEIIEKTGFKENSVRGTLSALKTEGFAERRGELWFLSQEKGSPALASEPRQSSGAVMAGAREPVAGSPAGVRLPPPPPIHRQSVPSAKTQRSG